MPQPHLPHSAPAAWRAFDLAIGCMVGLVAADLAATVYFTGEWESLVLGGIVLAGVAAFVYLYGRVSAAVVQAGGLGYVVAAVCAVHFVFPVGGDTIIYSVTATTLICWEVRSTRVAAVLVAVVLAAPGLAYFWGAGAGLVAAKPTWVTIGISGTFSILYAVLNVGRARRAYAAARARLAATEARIAEEVALLREQHGELAAANARLDAEAVALGTRLVDEQAATQRLRDALGNREQLATAIRHDLREPLRSITSFSQLLRRRLTRDLPDGKAADYLAFAEDGGRRMAAMVDDLLRYTQSDHGEDLTDVDLAAAVEEVRLNLADQLARTGATLSAGPLPTLRGYPTQVYQLLQNLVSNAVKFARPGVPPVIEITAADAGGDLGGEAARVTIADNGRGIPAHQLSEVFGLFNRSGNVGEVEGTGVGLALCRRIAIAHGGTLTVASVPGEGTAFHFVCPTAAVGGPTSPAALAPADATSPVTSPAA